LVDSGSGTLRKMLEVGITYRDIDLLLYTHIHPDHISEVVPILFACKYADLPRQEDLLCVGGPGFKHYFDQLKKLYGPWIEPQSYHLAFRRHGSLLQLRQQILLLRKFRSSLYGDRRKVWKKRGESNVFKTRPRDSPVRMASSSRC
jgi:ribonuclease BN (tRNA processing enzyme)